ncbi:MAG: prepilin-type N-terminal cleavage/methylation domain-containing protein [Candidatus Sumerlaeia bacterium]
MKKGFTLIELLIVVAIIAILAAIAVPNFLEAQVRAKVSRVKSDMRSMATAIEAYTIDNNKPVGMWCMEIPGVSNSAFHGWATGLSWYTTPVAFITSVFPDTFQLKPSASQVGSDTTFYDKFKEYQSQDDSSYWVDGPDGTQLAYDYDVSPWTKSAYNGNPVGDNTALYWDAWYGQNANWRLQSMGPDLEPNQVPANASWITNQNGNAWVYNVPWPDGVYDPTNGTVSAGNIIRTPQKSM